LLTLILTSIALFKSFSAFLASGSTLLDEEIPVAGSDENSVLVYF